MADKFKGLRIIFMGILSALSFLALYLLKIHPIVGSHYSFFSLLDAVTPLSGVLGIGGALGTFLIRMFLKASLCKISLYALVYHIPGLCASAYWATASRIFSVIVPMVCIVLFIAHPVGMGAAPYALYWLIPITVGLMNKKSPFALALTSTFIAHALGSIMWLYTVPMSSAVWLGLIPVVAYERLVFAGLMLVVYYAGAWIKADVMQWQGIRLIKGI